MKYRVARDCHGFRGGYWSKGQIVNVPDDEVVPHHFEPITDTSKVPDVPMLPPEPNTFSEINKANKTNRPKTGMAYQKPEKEKK